MIEEAIYKFKTVAPTVLPDLIDNFRLGSIASFADYAILPYEVARPMPLSQIVTILDEANIAILYHALPDTSVAKTLFGQKCCAYSYPNFDLMYKINCQTASDGLVHVVQVTIYSSMEDFGVEVWKDLHANESRGFNFLVRRPEGQIVNDFNVHR